MLRIAWGDRWNPAAGWHLSKARASPGRLHSFGGELVQRSWGAEALLHRWSLGYQHRADVVLPRCAVFSSCDSCLFFYGRCSSEHKQGPMDSSWQFWHDGTSSQQIRWCPSLKEKVENDWGKHRFLYEDRVMVHHSSKVSRFKHPRSGRREILQEFPSILGVETMVSDEDFPLKQQWCPNLAGEFLDLAQRHNAHLRGRGVIYGKGLHWSNTYGKAWKTYGEPIGKLIV